MMDKDLRSDGRRRYRWMGWGLLASLGLALSLGAASCGGSAGGGPPLLQSNTNWLQRCGPDAPCSGALLCLCGMCTQPCSESTECGRLEGASCGGSCAEAAPSGGGMCVLGCTTDDDCADDFTCQASECRPRPAPLDETTLGNGRLTTAGACPNAFVSLDSVFEQARRDLDTLDVEDRSAIRYVSLANRNDAGACANDLEIERLALAKMLNSTSLDSAIVLPVPIDADRLLYRINLRDYGWDERYTLAGFEYGNAWDMLLVDNPYAISFEGPDANVLIEQTQTPVPLIQSDALVYAAVRGEPYMALLQQPGTLDELLVDLGIDAETNRADGEALRVGTTHSLISRANRILERHDLEVRAGVLWLTFDFLSDSEQDSILQNPLATNATGGSVMYSLPNGLPGFALFDEAGALTIDSDILLDTNQNNFRALTAISCMNCHATPIMPTADEVGGFVAANPDAFSEADRERIALLYRDSDTLRQVMSSDNASFRSALENVGVPRDSSDAVATVVFRFERDMTPSEMAGDLMLAPSDAEALQTSLGIDLIVTRQGFEQSLSNNLCSSLASARNRPTLCQQLSP